jgi:hypothetical protein
MFMTAPFYVCNPGKWRDGLNCTLAGVTAWICVKPKKHGRFFRSCVQTKYLAQGFHIMSATVRIVLYIQGKPKLAPADKLTLSADDYLQVSITMNLAFVLKQAPKDKP